MKSVECVRTECWCVDSDDNLTAALHSLEFKFALQPPPPSPPAAENPEWFDILILAYQGSPGSLAFVGML